MKRRNRLKRIKLATEACARTTRDLELRLQANTVTLAAVWAATSPGIIRERWCFPRNENWFEDTLPHLGEVNFKQAFRVNPSTFRYLVISLQCVLERQVTNMRKPISAEKRVAVGLYRLCSSAEDRTIAHLFGIGRSTVNIVYREFCRAVVDIHEGTWVRMPRKEEIAEQMREFHAVTGFPQAMGALDGCHFPISPPKKDAADYYDYKGWYSIILLAVADHRYRFLYLKVESLGRCHDAHVYGRSRLKTIVESDHFNSPVSVIEGMPVLPIMLCDQAFTLTPHLMKPHANVPSGSKQAIFNYNLSKSRRIVENAFGRVKARFRFILKRMECKLSNAKLAIRASCTLHNICECFPDHVDEQWIQDVYTCNEMYKQPLHNSDACIGEGEDVRAALAEYFWKRAQ
ncbi:hypothetical protein HPB49_002343 [Dermacentor silvarum]|uniref:Uncharacterized protein n=1 Tax=Dermacentor silvarum TaxID=543639 RepID=A0ACB8DT96_DERSI|nr:hypothetical protein HPB49_002343 [Dermacentor silvarum]